MTLHNDLKVVSVSVSLFVCVFFSGMYDTSLAQVNEEESLSNSVSVDQKTPVYIIEKLPGGEVYSDFVVGPGRFAIEIAPGESKVVEMTVANRMGDKRKFSIGVEDMEGSSDPTRSVVLLGEEKGPYTLRDNIRVPYMEFELEHAERARIPVTVSLPQDAEPGGRYGTLLVSVISKSNDGEVAEGAKPGSVVVSRIGTLFFVTTPGKIEQNMELKSFSIREDKHFLSSGPVSFNIVSQNNGSVHTTPYGEIRILNMTGKEVGFVELEPWFVMPKSLRLREVSWNRELLLGRYTAVLKVNRGYEDIVDEKAVTFWIVPYTLILSMAGALFLFFFILHFVLTQFEFKRKAG